MIQFVKDLFTRKKPDPVATHLISLLQTNLKNSRVMVNEALRNDNLTDTPTIRRLQFALARQAELLDKLDAHYSNPTIK